MEDYSAIVILFKGEMDQNSDVEQYSSIDGPSDSAGDSLNVVKAGVVIGTDEKVVLLCEEAVQGAQADWRGEDEPGLRA